MPEDLPSRLRAMVPRGRPFTGGERADATILAIEAADEIGRLRSALDLAVGMLMMHEPGDSRAVSDEAVALASVVCDCTNDETWRIISAARARLVKEA